MGLLARVRTSFVAGLLLIAPLAVTVFVLNFAFQRLSGVLDSVVVGLGLGTVVREQLLAQVLAAAVIATAIVALGYIASFSIGQRLFGSLERGLKLVPLVRTVYFGVRQVSESIVERTAGFESVVLVEFHRRGAYSIGFVTNEAPRAAGAVTEESMYTVFIPNSPNPTAGALLMLPETDIHEVDISVRRGIRMLVTTGLSVDDDELPTVTQGDGAGLGTDPGPSQD